MVEAPLKERAGVGVRLPLPVAVLLGDVLRVDVGEVDPLRVTVSLEEAVGELLGVAGGVAVGEGVPVGLPLGVRVDVPVPVCEALTVVLAEGCTTGSM